MKKIKLSVAENNLEKAVIRWLNSKGGDYENGAEGAFKDLQYGGCQSGIVSELIYTSETRKFYFKHRADINSLLVESLADCGMDIVSLFGDKWDKADPLALDDQNQNLLAWFGFEESANRIMSRLGVS